MPLAGFLVLHMLFHAHHLKADLQSFNRHILTRFRSGFFACRGRLGSGPVLVLGIALPPNK